MKQFTDLYAETAKSAMFTIGYGSVDGKFMITTHTTDQQGGASGWGSFTVDGTTAVVQLGDRQLGVPGKIVMGRVDNAEQCILLNANTCTARLGGRQAGHGKLVLRNVNGIDTVAVDGENGNITLGGGGQDGDVTLKNASGASTIVLNATSAELTMGGNGSTGDIKLLNPDGKATIVIDSSNAAIALGGSGTNGDITIKDEDDRVTALLDSDGNLTLGGVGSDGDIHVKNSCDVETITISGESGDILFKNADIAEEFDVSPEFNSDVGPGTVVVLDDEGRLTPCAEAYDGRVVGVVAGGGAYRPGIVLDRRSGNHRRAVAMVGKVFCRVDAGPHPVRVGDLLTTSVRPGHAMRVADRERAFGSIIGKALAPLAGGAGLIPVLVKPRSRAVMPISIKRDVKPAFQFGTNFSLRKTPIFRNTGETVLFSGGSYLDAIRPQIADRNWTQFYNSWPVGAPDDVKRNVTRAIASKFNLQGRDDIYNELFTFVNHARLYEKNQRESIDGRLDDSYLFAARVAASVDVDEPCFRRAADTQATNIVVFSDLHMTAQPHLPSYFKKFNYQLYLDVLDQYAASQFTLVENGDVEDCLVYDPTLEEAKERTRVAPKVTPPLGWQGSTYFDPESHLPAGHFDLPIRPSDPRWQEFLVKRYNKRERNQQDIFDAFPEYYEKIVTLFARYGRYFRLTGNHDTYLDGDFESTLKTRIEGKLGAPVYDALRVKRGSTTNPVTKYLIMHGHQFDSVCLQAGDTPYAKSLGEIYSECVSWAFQGAERVWTLDDTKKWYYCNKGISNVLAREEPGTYFGGSSDELDLVLDNLDRIKKQPRDFIETLLEHEIGWEYFENTNAFEAFTLEVWTGDESYKLRSLNEVDLCLRYTNSFLDINPPQTAVPIPKLIIGHTHEPRQNAVFPVDPGEDEPWERRDNNAGVYYLNSGSAGRFEKLIWCVEITGDEDRIVSWSNIDGKLTRIPWRSEGDKLVHDV